MKQTYVLLIAILLIAGCANAVTAPENIEIEFRYCEAYVDVTGPALPLIHYTVMGFGDGKVTLELTLSNQTQFRPRNFQLIWNGDVENEDGMTRRGFGTWHDYTLFNDGYAVGPGSYIEYVTVEFPVTPVYVWGLFGPDPRDGKFICEDSNNYYDYYGNHGVAIYEFNGHATDTGLRGRFPVMSYGAEWIACITNPYSGGYARLKNMSTGEVIDIQPPQIGGTDMEMYELELSIDGRYLAFKSGVPQTQDYLYLYDIGAGTITMVEASTDGSLMCAAMFPHFSGDGRYLFYSYNDNPVWLTTPWNVRRYDIASKQIAEITDYPETEFPDRPAKISVEDVNYDGSEVLYRYGTTENGITAYDIHLLKPETGEDIILVDTGGEEYIEWATMGLGGHEVYYNYSPTQEFRIERDVYKVDKLTLETSLVLATVNEECTLFYDEQNRILGMDYVWGSPGIWGWSFADKDLWQVTGTGMFPRNANYEED